MFWNYAVLARLLELCSVVDSAYDEWCLEDLLILKKLDVLEDCWSCNRNILYVYGVLVIWETRLDRICKMCNSSLGKWDLCIRLIHLFMVVWRCIYLSRLPMCFRGRYLVIWVLVSEDRTLSHLANDTRSDCVKRQKWSNSVEDSTF